MKLPTESALKPLCAAGLPEHDAREWSESFPIMTGEFEPRRSRLRGLLAPLGGSSCEAAAEVEAEQSGTSGC